MKTRGLYIKSFIVWMGILLLPATILGQVSQKISQANQLYNQDRFSEAAELYEQAIAEGMKNGHLHYNLGNTYFRMNKLPKAILHYIKAQNLLPRNEDVEANLEYAIRQTEDQLDGRNPHPLETILFWTRDLNLEEHKTGLFWINFFFWISVGIGLRYRTPATQSARNIFLAFLVLAAVSTGFRWHKDSHQSVGVILPEQIDVYSDWNTSSVVLFQLHRGTPVSISKEKGNWYEIELLDAKKGWALKSHIAG